MLRFEDGLVFLELALESIERFRIEESRE